MLRFSHNRKDMDTQNFSFILKITKDLAQEKRAG
jgi:hypothetical protein